jgi:asparagine synthase (glutamine-hydrolysing)
MCGFIGTYSDKGDFNLQQCKQALNSISHRGPDNEGHYISDGVFLGHRRLSIIDLSEDASQPFKAHNEEVFIVFNGEIYNYQELKSDLQAKVNFRSQSDTEVIVNGYLVYGIDFFSRLRGIYAFAIYDKPNKKIFLVRDPSGVKPLYLYNKDKNAIFSSEIKGIVSLVKNKLSTNDKVLKAYLNLGYCPEPYTIYNEISAVQPGKCIEISDKKAKEYNILSYNFSKQNNLAFSENLERVEEYFNLAVKRNLIADVKVSVALSGGIDSSLIYASALKNDQNLQGISVTFNDKEYDESSTAKAYAESLSGKLDVIKVNNEFSLETLNKILEHFDQPYADSSAIPVYFLTKAARKYTKVLVGGDGGDELFNGYPSQTILQFLNTYKNKFPSGAVGPIGAFLTKLLSGNKKREAIRTLDLWNSNSKDMIYDRQSWFPRNTKFRSESPFLFDTAEGKDLYFSAFSKDEPDNFDDQVVFNYFRKTMLGDYLRKTDMMSMMNGLEYRVPFLDEDLTQYALQIPFDQKSNLRTTKFFLRELHKKYYNPALSKLPKKGFSIPLDKNLQPDEFSYMKEILLNPKDNILHEFIRKEYIVFLFKALQDSQSYRAEISRGSIYQRILMLYSLQHWYKNNKT